MHPKNDAIRDYLGVTAWHAAGYTGRRGLTLSGEDFRGGSAHARYTLDAFHEIAPDRTVLYRQLAGDERMDAIAETGADTMFVSLSTPNYGAGDARRFDEKMPERLFLCAAAGNGGAAEYNTFMLPAHIYGVGAVTYGWSESRNGAPCEGAKLLILPAGYSGESEYVDFACFTDLVLEGKDNRPFTGTSCACPVLVGLAALVNDFFIDRTGKPLTHGAMYRFLKDCAEDNAVYGVGKDDKTGWGVPRLPAPETIEILNPPAAQVYCIGGKPPMASGDDGGGENRTEADGLKPVDGKTNTGLCAYAQAQLGRPYWFGTFGQTATAALYARQKAQYPGYYTAKDFAAQYGQRVHDCSGLIKGYLMSRTAESAPVYSAALDKSADGLLSMAARRGEIGTMPETPGILVHMPGHVGIYMGGGYVIEARGHAYGVVKTCLTERSWKQWSRCPLIMYTEDEDVFRDTAGHWAEKSIGKCVEAGLMNGRTADTFAPDESMTRAELATVMARLLEKLETTGEA